jgi:hypothetical protein
MKRLDHLLWGFKDSVIWYPKDIAKLKAEIPDLTDLSDPVVQSLYNVYSQDFYSAGWMLLTDSMLKEFKNYLLEEV